MRLPDTEADLLATWAAGYGVSLNTLVRGILHGTCLKAEREGMVELDLGTVKLEVFP